MSSLLQPVPKSWKQLAAVLVVMAAGGFALAWAVPPFFLAFKDPLEQRFQRPRLSSGDAIAGIVVLGGGRERAQEALRLADRFATARVILTGPHTLEADMFRKAAGNDARFVIDRSANTTYQNAIHAKRIAEPKPGERWLLVTSALHMPRAMGVFTAANFVVEPWPVDDSYIHEYRLYKRIAWEIFGLVSYRLLGRTVELFPSAQGVTGQPGAIARHADVSGPVVPQAKGAAAP